VSVSDLSLRQFQRYLSTDIYISTIFSMGRKK
jgi:hypothetical protein